MRIWKEQVKVPKHGICTVKEAEDTECTNQIAPISHGFVNLYHGDRWVAFCGVFYAEEHKIKR